MKRFSDGLRSAVCVAVFVVAMLPTAYAAPRVATSDWSVAETLAAIGLPPAGVGDKRAYGVWVGYPALDDRTADTGLRFQPNLERIRQLRPDMFVQSSWFSHLKSRFSVIAPVYEIDFAAANGVDYRQTLAATRKLGALLGAQAEAEKLITESERLFAERKQAVQSFAGRPLAVVQFIDPRHLRIYGKTSMYQTVLDRIGLKNAWTGASNTWGFTNIALTELAKLPPETLLVIVQPHPHNVRSTLEKSALWQRLPFADRRNRRVLPPSWSYGALPSMQRFADRLAEALPSEKEGAW